MRVFDDGLVGREIRVKVKTMLVSGSIGSTSVSKRHTWLGKSLTL